MATLLELKEFLAGLSDDQLSKPALLLGSEDEYPFGELSISELEEDLWYSSDGAFPLSVLDKEERREYLDSGEAHVIWNKGSIFFDLKVE